MTGVTWEEADRYCRSVAGRRLPTETEWEYAARGPNHAQLYHSKYKPVLTLDDAGAMVKGKAIQIGGAYTRNDFKRGLEPVYIMAVAQRLGHRTVVLRQRQNLARAKMKFGGRPFLVQDHGLAPGSYKLKIGIYTEHASGTKSSYQRGSRVEKTVDVTIP